MSMAVAGAVSLGVSVAGGVMSYEGQKSAAQAGANNAYAQGAFADYQQKLTALHDQTQGSQIMDQATQQIAIMAQKAASVRGTMISNQGGSGAVIGVGSAQAASDMVQKLSTADVLATMGSAINKNTALVGNAVAANANADNAITSASAQAASIAAAGGTAADATLLSTIGNTGLQGAKMYATPTPSGQ